MTSERSRCHPVIAVSVVVLAALLAAGCNVYRAFRPSTHTDSVAPELPAQLPPPAVLVYSKTNAFRHAEAIERGTEVLHEIAATRGWSLFATENGAVFNVRDLERFDAVVWHNATGDSLDDAQKAAFRGWLEAGHGYFGTHAAGDGSHTWPWYRARLIGPEYARHPMGPQFQEARVDVENHNHPATRKLPASFLHTEEWYSFAESPRGAEVMVLASVDERTYEPWIRFLGSEEDLRMGDDHPILWARCAGRGRAIYSALGHQAEAYDTEPVRAILEGAIAWAAGIEGAGCR